MTSQSVKRQQKGRAKYPTVCALLSATDSCSCRMEILWTVAVAICATVLYLSVKCLLTARLNHKWTAQCNNDQKEQKPPLSLLSRLFFSSLSLFFFHLRVKLERQSVPWSESFPLSPWYRGILSVPWALVCFCLWSGCRLGRPLGGPSGGWGE